MSLTPLSTMLAKTQICPLPHPCKMILILIEMIFLDFSVSDAKAYVDFILNSIRRKDLFHSIELKPESCWEYLMWMDQVITIIIFAKKQKFQKIQSCTIFCKRQSRLSHQPLCFLFTKKQVLKLEIILLYQANHGGVRGKLPNEAEDDEVIEGIADDSDEIMATPDDEVKGEKNTQHCKRLPYLLRINAAGGSKITKKHHNQSDYTAAFLKDKV